MIYKTLHIKLKIERHESKAVNRGRTDYTMTKKGQRMVYKYYTENERASSMNTTKTGSELMCSRR